MDNLFAKYWAGLEKLHGTLLFDTEANKFYYMRDKFNDGHYKLSPIDSPNEVEHVKSDFLIDLRTYILENNDTDTAQPRHNNGSFTADSRKNSGNFTGNSRKVSESAQNETAQFSGLHRSVTDKLMDDIRKQADKVRGMTASKKAASHIKANMWQIEGQQWHLRGDEEELREVLQRLKGLESKVKSIRQAPVKGKINKRNKNIKIALLVFASICLVVFIGWRVFLYLYRTYNEASAPTLVQPVKVIKSDEINQMINAFEQERGIKIYTKRREKIIELITKMPNTHPVSIIDSISTADWHSL